MPDERPRTKWQTFAGWHQEPSLYREMYTRTVSALAAALVIYLIAAASGVVSQRPLTTLLIILMAYLLLTTAWYARVLLRGLKRLREMPDDEERDKARLLLIGPRVAIVIGLVGLPASALLWYLLQGR